MKNWTTEELCFVKDAFYNKYLDDWDGAEENEFTRVYEGLNGEFSSLPARDQRLILELLRQKEELLNDSIAMFCLYPQDFSKWKQEIEERKLSICRSALEKIST